VPVSLGCDGGPSNNTYDMIREMRLAALIHKPVVKNPLVVSAEDVIEMATLGGAVAMGLNKKIGSLEAGKQADVIIIDMHELGLTPAVNPVSNLVYSGSGQSVDTVLVNGKVLMRDKKLLALNTDTVMKNARAHIIKLLERADVDISPKWPVL
jgi:cytosine/adenosine deaminase-related metal-dependent hydrolase